MLKKCIKYLLIPTLNDVNQLIMQLLKPSLILSFISSLILACTPSVPENSVVISDSSKEDSLLDSTWALVDSFRFKDSTELQIFTKETIDSLQCHYCSPPIVLRRSSKSSDGKITWKQTAIDAVNQWGKVGVFYVDELDDCPELLFYRGWYSQHGFTHSWINAFRTESFVLGRKEWSFSFMESTEENLHLPLDSIARLKEFTSQGITPAETYLITSGNLEIDVQPGILNLQTSENEYVMVFIKEDERSVDYRSRTKTMSLYYNLDYGNVYLDSVWQTNK